MFVYEDDWESNNDTLPKISLAKQTTDTLCLDDKHEQYYSYSEYEPVMTLDQGYELVEFAKRCTKRHPMHCCNNDITQ